MTEEKIEVLFQQRTEAEGAIRLERWPEGLVLWVGGEIQWKSWRSEKDAISVTLSADTTQMQALLRNMAANIKEALS